MLDHRNLLTHTYNPAVFEQAGCRDPPALPAGPGAAEWVSPEGDDPMTQPPLQPAELELVCWVLRQHPEVVSATLFGSRAKGTHSIERVGIVIYPEG